MCAAFAGAGLIPGKLVLDRVEPLVFSFYLMTFAALFSGALSLSKGEVKREYIGPAGFPALGAHVISVFFAIYFLWAGLRLMDPAAASLLHRAEVVFTALLAAWFLREIPGPGDWLGIVIALFGVLVMKSSLGAESGGPAELIREEAASTGFWLTLASTFFFAVSDVTAKKSIAHIHFRTFTFIRNGILAPVFALAVLCFSDFTIPAAWDLSLIALSAFMGPFLARLLFLSAIRSISVTAAVLISQTQPLFAGGLAFFISGVALGPREALGGALIVAGCVVLILAGRRTD